MAKRTDLWLQDLGIWLGENWYIPLIIVAVGYVIWRQAFPTPLERMMAPPPAASLGENPSYEQLRYFWERHLAREQKIDEEREYNEANRP